MKVLLIDNTHPNLQITLEKNNFVCHHALSLSKSEIEEKISEYEGILIRSRFEIDSQFIDKAINLKFIARAGSGMENIDVSYAKLKKIKCFNAAEGNRQAVAEHAIGMILSLFNKLNISDQEVRKGKWNREKNRGIELFGKTIGIIGFGNNGSAFAKVLEGFGVNILCYDKYLESYSYQSTMEKIYEQADIVSLHIPLNEETKYLVDKDFIEKFEKNIFIINTSRGKCVNTKDLVMKIKDKKVLGACLDVLEYEKLSFEQLSKIGDNQELRFLLESKNVILSPHIAGWTHESRLKISEILTKKILSEFQK
tara:strand:- start:366 stop:1295 length:930 start_codon:yes stop_codon:yes gene_type:complete